MKSERHPLGMVLVRVREGTHVPIDSIQKIEPFSGIPDRFTIFTENGNIEATSAEISSFTANLNNILRNSSYT